MRERHHPILIIALAALVFLVAIGAPAVAEQPCDARANNSPKKLLDCVTVDGVREHQAAFQAIADANGGTRASGTAGYDASAGYVADRLEAAGYDVTIQEFTFPFFNVLSQSFSQTSPVSRTFAPFDRISETGDFDVMTFSGSGATTDTPVAATNDLIIPYPPDPHTSTSGCELADFLDGGGSSLVAGKVALIQRGTCTFYDKVQNAQAAGAVAALIFNEGQPGRDGVLRGTLGMPGANIPALGISYGLGVELTAAGTRVSLDVQTISEFSTTVNVLAETLDGRDDRIIMAGAHLDSVMMGPGIQDNGSGSAALLEIAEQIHKVKPRNKVRFAWWGAGEQGREGSYQWAIQAHGSGELANVALYLDIDQIGSPNFVRFVYDGDSAAPGSEVIEQLFAGYFAGLGLAFQEYAPGGTKDSWAFSALGVPVGGLFAGASEIKTEEEAAIYGGTAGEQYDPCYHLACDTFDNVSLEVLDQMSDAAAYAIISYAMDLAPLDVIVYEPSESEK